MAHDALISRHMFRRTARWKARRLLRHGGVRTVVVPARRGPYRWELREEPTR